ncbi:hypothetical protein, partial [Escherichia coli]|uniref:hypothetical protein n=1 Tax=Escherichia coli TaxID=562 RepID=UPI001BCA24DC
ADRNRSHWSTSKTPSYTKSVSWQHHQLRVLDLKRQDVRNAIAVAENAETLFSSGLANDY